MTTEAARLAARARRTSAARAGFLMCGRLTAFVSAGTVVILLSGCITPPARPVEADGTYCHRIGKSYRLKRTCTAMPVPSEAVEAGAKRFEPSPEATMLYIVRRRWGDTANRVPVAVDDRTPVLTIPDSLVRVRLQPGSHRVALDWEGRQQANSSPLQPAMCCSSKSTAACGHGAQPGDGLNAIRRVPGKEP